MASRGRRALGAAAGGGRALSPRGKTSPRVALGLLYYEPCVPLAVIAEGLGRWAWLWRARVGMCGLRVLFSLPEADLDLWPVLSPARGMRLWVSDILGHTSFW